MSHHHVSSNSQPCSYFILNRKNLAESAIHAPFDDVFTDQQIPCALIKSANSQKTYDSQEKDLFLNSTSLQDDQRSIVYTDGMLKE